jgi:nicotinate-nucleotide pyrophosphorylase (carboxylating)
MEFMEPNLLNKSLQNLQSNNTLRAVIEHDVRNALDEDVGNGDLTAQLIPASQLASATIISRESAIICGMAWAERCFKLLDANIQIQWQMAEGEVVSANQVLCEIGGNAREMLTAERCALNFLQTLSATATITRRYVDTIAGTKAHILDTRKTLPGLRLAQKYAVTIGGGMNQRLGLYDGILIKENHIAAAGSIEAVLQAARSINKSIPIQIEVESLLQLKTALDARAELILLDNFSPVDLRKAVSLNAGRAMLEASGGIDLTNVREIALTGVDRISIGSLTKNIQAIDLTMRFK